MLRLKYILRHRYIIKITTLLILIFVIIFTNTFSPKSSLDSKETSFVGKIIEIKNDHIFLDCGETIIINNYKSSLLMPGDKIKVEGTLSKIKKNTIPNIFNYQKYLSYRRIFYTIQNPTIVKIANNTSIINFIKAKILKRIDTINCNSAYIKLFILGNNTFLEDEIKESYRLNGISHLFAISGMHISLFAGFLLMLLKKISYNNLFNYSVVILFLISYSLLVGLNVSILRSIIMYILFTINKLANLKISMINLMCLVLIIMLTMDPLFIYQTSFLYSYIISFSLILFQKKIKSHKSYLKKTITVSIISFLVSFPINIYNNYQVCIFSIILNIIFVPLVSFIILPLTLLSIILPKLYIILAFFISIMEQISLFVSNNNLGIIVFAKPHMISIIIYYILIYPLIYNHKYFYIFIVLTFYKLYPLLDNSIKVTFLDIGQGDATILKMPYTLAGILIDSGGNINYNLSKSKTIPYLKSLGISKISMFIITHGDFDHMGEAINLVNNFKVEKVIFNCGPYNDLEKELIKVLDKKHIKYYSCIKELNIDNNKLYFLQTEYYDNENDNSNVIYTELDGYKFMFMGDASVTTEKEIISKYNLPNIDVLKVGHHGSKTSSGKDFINEINPKYSIISVGKNNRYGHPNKEVLDNLSDSKIYRTDQDGSIMFKINNDKLKIETCSP